ncbi:MAG: hypothetical protein WAW85_13610 [Gordonia sp. (in: high G+C Gram-positive bacteria)]|uniref:hypothetical protein n=1 Tax=Gordonia sp. (in: high G+C Gram-positive bacteria) TaxID=84139 RepID=UPI003BB4A65E
MVAVVDYRLAEAADSQFRWQRARALALGALENGKCGAGLFTLDEVGLPGAYGPQRGDHFITDNDVQASSFRGPGMVGGLSGSILKA